MDLKKIKIIINWQDLQNIIGLKLFLGFVIIIKDLL